MLVFCDARTSQCPARRCTSIDISPVRGVLNEPSKFRSPAIRQLHRTKARPGRTNVTRVCSGSIVDPAKRVASSRTWYSVKSRPTMKPSRPDGDEINLWRHQSAERCAIAFVPRRSKCDRDVRQRRSIKCRLSRCGGSSEQQRHCEDHRALHCISPASNRDATLGEPIVKMQIAGATVLSV